MMSHQLQPQAGQFSRKIRQRLLQIAGARSGRRDITSPLQRTAGSAAVAEEFRIDEHTPRRLFV